MTDLLEHIEKADKKDLFTVAGKQGMKLDIPEIPELMIDNTDRNRTSPFAFTGNRFEFRAVGSEANCASAMIVLNTAVAEALTDFKKRVDELIAKGEDKTSAIIDIVRQDLKTCKPIRFDGNGYSDEWVEEAAKRGLDCEKSCPKIFERYLDPATIKMFEDMGVMKKNELEARNEVKWETYTKKIQIEARVMGDLSMNHIIPVATHYQSQLAKNVENMIDIFGDEEGKKLTARNIKIIKKIAERTQIIETGVEELVNARKVANKIENEHDKAIAYHDTVFPDKEMKEKIRQLIKTDIDNKMPDRGQIGNNVKIINTKEITNCVINDLCEVNGASRLSDCTLLGSVHGNVYIGTGVIIENSIIAEGSSVINSVKIQDCFVGEACQLSNGFTASASVFFANSYMSNGEACAAFCGPFTASHHKSSLLIGGMFSFYNAGSATNFSNHAYKMGPMHWGILERGSKTASGAYLLMPATLGSFSVCFGKLMHHQIGRASCRERV